jgi:methionine-rich copper-binding protein CopC
MARIARCVGRRPGRLRVGLLAAALVVLVVVVVPPGPAAAHARLVGSSPEPGATVERAPDEVVIELDAKPATVEGDPLQVYGPDGRRVDARDPHVGEQGRRLAVTLDTGEPRPSGEYQVAYRVVSADSHVITGRLSFTVGLPSPAPDGADRDGAAVVGRTGPASLAADAAGAGSHRLIPGGPHDLRPPLVAAGALALAALTLLLRGLWALWRRPAPRAAWKVGRSPSPSPRRDRHGPGSARRRAGPHGRPPGPRARGHRVPPRAGGPPDGEAFWAGAGTRRVHRRAPAPSGAPWWSVPEGDRWP